MSDRKEHLDELIQRARNGYKLYEPVFASLSDAYLLYLDENNKKSLSERNKSSIFFPKINAKAKRIMDAFSETYFNNESFAKLDNFVNSDPKILKMWQRAIDFYSDQINLYHIFQPCFLKVTFLGTAIAKVFWQKDRVQIEMLDIDEVYFDPNAKDKDDIRYIVHKFSSTKDDIDNLAKNSIYNKKITKQIKQNYPFERINLYDIYEKINDKWYLSTTYESDILRDKIPLKDGCPIIIGYVLPQVKRILNDDDFVGVYGEPPLASILPLQDELNRIRNSMLDGVKAQLSPKLIINKSAKLSQHDIETPGKPIYTSDPNSVQIMPFPNITQAISTMQITDNDMSEATGISPQQNGATTIRAETATMSSIMANEGSVRLQGYIRTFNETFFEPIFERFAMLVWKYGDPVFFAGFRRDEIMSFKVNLNTGIGALNKEVQKNALIQAGQLLNEHFQMCLATGENNGALNMVLAHEQLIAQILAIFGIKDFEKYLKKDGDELIRTLSTTGDFNYSPNPNENGGFI